MANSKLLLEAIAAGDAERATVLAVELAERIEASEVVTLARRVREGGPLMMAHAVTLARRCLTTNERDDESSKRFG